MQKIHDVCHLNKAYDMQLPYNSAFNIEKEKYYVNIVIYGIEHHFTYPYHLISDIKVHPISYYVSILQDLVSNEFDYAQIPLFLQLELENIYNIKSKDYDSIKKMSEQDFKQYIEQKITKNVQIPSYLLKLFTEFRLTNKECHPEDFNEEYNELFQAGGVCKFSNDKKKLKAFNYLYSHEFGVPIINFGDDKIIYYHPNDNIKLINAQSYYESLAFRGIPVLLDGMNSNQLSKYLKCDVLVAKALLGLLIWTNQASFDVGNNMHFNDRQFYTGLVVTRAMVDMYDVPKFRVLVNKCHCISKEITDAANDLENCNIPSAKSLALYMRYFDTIKDFQKGLLLHESLSVPFTQFSVRTWYSSVFYVSNPQTISQKVIGVANQGPFSEFVQSPWMNIYSINQSLIHGNVDTKLTVYIWPKGFNFDLISENFEVQNLYYVSTWELVEKKTFITENNNLIENIKGLIDKTAVLAICLNQTSINSIPGPVVFPSNEMHISNQLSKELLLDSMCGTFSHIILNEIPLIYHINYGLQLTDNTSVAKQMIDSLRQNASVLFNQCSTLPPLQSDLNSRIENMINSAFHESFIPQSDHKFILPII